MAQISQATRDRYLVRRQVELTLCEDARKANDLATIESIGHKMKGNGATFGFPEISELGEKLEVAAQEHRLNEIDQCLGQISTWLKAKTQN